MCAVAIRNGGSNGGDPDARRSILPPIIECIRTAAGADVVAEFAPTRNTAPNGRASANPSGDPINYMDRLGLPALGLGLSAGALAGMAIPGLLVGGVILVAAMPIFKRTLQGIRDEHQLTVDFLDATAIILLTVQGSFLAPAFIVGVIEGSEILRDWTARRSQQASLHLLMAHERQVLVERYSRQMRLPWDAVETGDVILAYPGDQIPVDGVVLAGSALVDQHQMTGDSTPVTRKKYDDVHAATLVVEGHLRILAKRTGKETQASALLALMDAAPSTDTRVSNYARKVGNWAVVPTLATGAAVWAMSGSVARATGIVSLDLGKGMRVSAPIAILSAQTYAAQYGILIRSGRALEMLAQVDTVVFDKTATLTEGRASVVEIRARCGIPPTEVLMLAASAEAALDHPVARSIVRYAQECAIQPQRCTEWTYNAGQGVVAEIEGQSVHVGSRTLLEEAGIDVDATLGTAKAVEAEAATSVYVARNGELVGIILLADALRAESTGVIANLRRMNVASLMLSGDSDAVAHAAAANLNIIPQHVYADALPQQKVGLVQALRASRRTVAVVGDGINDAAAMAHADVSISLGSATDLARETADIVLLNNDLGDLLVAMEIAQHTMQIIEQNKALVIVPNIGAIAYGVIAVMSPVAGVVINNGSALVAALNSLRPLNGPGKRATQQATDDLPTNYQPSEKMTGI